MAKVTASPEELRELSWDMNRWKQQLSSLNSKLKNRVKNMDSWRDPQHSMFLNTIEVTARQVEGYARTMERMSQSLYRYAEDLDEHRKNLRNNIDSRS